METRDDQCTQQPGIFQQQQIILGLLPNKVLIHNRKHRRPKLNFFYINTKNKPHSENRAEFVIYEKF